jgi:integrase
MAEESGLIGYGRVSRRSTARRRVCWRKCSAAPNRVRTPGEALRRWVPWLCAYTGARAGEITQLRVVDVVEREGIDALHLTPAAGTIKTGAPRTIPIHEHLIAQGFLDFAKSRGNRPLFYNPETNSNAPDDPSNPRRPRAVKSRERLAAWVRRVAGIKDTEIRPNHAWRHTFKQVARRCGIPDAVSDEITGHAPPTVGRGYGRPTLADMAAELKKFPRYLVEPELL